MTQIPSEHYILFQKFPLIYARIPKVANSSIKAALTRLLSKPPEESYRTTSDMMWRKGTNGETTMIEAHAAQQRRSSHFIFTFVRNPFDRLVSAYNNKIIENTHLSTAMRRMGLELNMPFQTFLEITCNTGDADLDVHLLPQSKILLHRNSLVPRFIGRMETMEEDWTILRRRLRQSGLPSLGRLPEKNIRRSGDNDLACYYCSDYLIQSTINRYNEDIKLFYGDQDVHELAKGNLNLKTPPLELI